MEISYERIQNLSSNNNYFRNALSMYYSFFYVSDYQVSFVLLMISLKTLLGLDTYGKPETCTCCNQKNIKFQQQFRKI